MWSGDACARWQRVGLHRDETHPAPVSPPPRVGIQHLLTIIPGSSVDRERFWFLNEDEDVAAADALAEAADASTAAAASAAAASKTVAAVTGGKLRATPNRVGIKAEIRVASTEQTWTIRDRQTFWELFAEIFALWYVIQCGGCVQVVVFVVCCCCCLFPAWPMTL